MINVNEKYRIITDENNYVSQYKRDSKDPSKNAWRLVGYYGDLAGAIKGIVDYEARRRLGADVFSLREALDEVNAIKAEIEEMLTVPDSTPGPS